MKRQHDVILVFVCNKYGVYLTNGHNRLATGTIKAYCYEMNIFTECSSFWKVKSVLSCVVLIMEFTVLAWLGLEDYCLVLLLTVLVLALGMGV